MTVTIDNRFKLRRGTAADLAAVNEVPLEGELILETDTRRLKIGDGTTAWTALKYVESGLWLRALGDVDASTLADGLVPTWDAASSTHKYKSAGKTYQAGTGISIDSTIPQSPVISSTLGAIALSGRVATYATLPTGLGTAGAGKAYLVDADGLVYVWNGTAYPSQGDGVTAGGGGKVVGDIIADTSGAVNFVFSGLSLDDDFCYDLDMLILPNGAFSSAMIWFNNDQVSANYRRSRNGGQNSDSYIVDGGSSPSIPSGYNGRVMKLPGGRPVASGVSAFPQGSTDQNGFATVVTWVKTENVNTITIACSGCLPGSRVRLMRR